MWVVIVLLDGWLVISFKGKEEALHYSPMDVFYTLCPNHVNFVSYVSCLLLFSLHDSGLMYVYLVFLVLFYFLYIRCLMYVFLIRISGSWCCWRITLPASVCRNSPTTKIDEDVEHMIKTEWLKWRLASGVICDRQMSSRLKENF